MKLKQVLKKSNILATIISLVAREESRQGTIKSLQAFGLEPLVIESDPLDHAMNHGNHFGNSQASVKAIQAALDAKSNLLFCEDDIVLSKHFGVYVNWAAEANEVTYFYAHDKTDKLKFLYNIDNGDYISVKARQEIQPKLVPFETTRYLPFTQCVFIPLEILESFDLDSIAQGTRSFDIWLQEYLTKKQIKPLVALPHPVQHLQNREGRKVVEGQEYKRSLSFVQADQLNV